MTFDLLEQLSNHSALCWRSHKPLKLLTGGIRTVPCEVIVQPDFDSPFWGEADHIVIQVYWTVPFEYSLVPH